MCPTDCFFFFFLRPLPPSLFHSLSFQPLFLFLALFFFRFLLNLFFTYFLCSFESATHDTENYGTVSSVCPNAGYDTPVAYDNHLGVLSFFSSFFCVDSLTGKKKEKDWMKHLSGRHIYLYNCCVCVKFPSFKKKKQLHIYSRCLLVHRFWLILYCIYLCW